MASLLAMSHELNMRGRDLDMSGAPEQSRVCRNLKVGPMVHPALPQTLREALLRDADLGHRTARLFDAHPVPGLDPFPGIPGEFESSAGPVGVRGARVEAVSGGGVDGTGGGVAGGLPSNELQEAIQRLLRQKLAKRRKSGREAAGSMRLHANAVAAVGVVVEELATDMAERWREAIRFRCELKRRRGGREGEGEVEVCGPFAGSLQSPEELEEEELFQAAALQARGADLQSLYQEELDEDFDPLLQLLQNRMEVMHVRTHIISYHHPHQIRLLQQLY
jgi:hypothetical protein